MKSLIQRSKDNVKFLEKNIDKKFEDFFKNNEGLLYDVSLQDLLTWTIGARKIKGEKFSFDGRPYLNQIYKDEDYYELNIVKPRQMEVTEFALNWLLYNLIKNPFTVGLYMSDRQDHVRIFSKLRLQSGAIEQSDYLKSKVPKNEHNVSWQPFKNGSHLYMLSAWGDFEAARSIPVDFAVVDEMQSVNVEALPVLKESMSKSRFRKIVKIGTGGDEGDDWWNEWHNGTQYYWEWGSVNTDRSHGSWLRMPNTEIVPMIKSYRLNQYMARWIPEASIEYKRRTYTPRRFANEVEGWWYKGMRRPLIEKEIRNLFDRSLDFTLHENVDHTMPVFLGVDWGGGTQAFTVAWIWQLVNEAVPRFKLLYVTKITEPSTEKQADMVSELMDKYQVDQAVMDSGGGTRQVEKLSKKYGSRIYKCHYRYNSEDPFEPISSEYRINVDRTWIIETLIDLINRPEESPAYPKGIPRIHIPAKNLENIEWIIDHFTCIEAETSESSGKSFVKYIHSEETNDDALHAAGYAYLAWLVSKGANWTWARFG